MGRALSRIIGADHRCRSEVPIRGADQEAVMQHFAQKIGVLNRSCRYCGSACFTKVEIMRASPSKCVVMIPK